MDARRIDLSIVIVTWNARDYTLQCLKSLQQQDSALSTETIVVDNASSDGTADMIRKDFPHVKLVENDCNHGFPKGSNVGIRLAKGKYIFLINPDVIVRPTCLGRMVRYMEQDPSIGLLGPRILAPDGAVQRSTMRFPTVWNSFCRALALDSLFKGSKTFGGFLMSDFAHDKAMDVDILNGCFWLVRREALNRVGLLDEQIFMYADDLDWCYRFHEAGLRVVFYPQAEAVHYGGGTTASAPTFYYIEKQRSNLQFWKKHHGRPAVFGYLLTVWLHEVVQVLGHGALYCFKGSARHDASLKVRRSLACLSWLSRSRSGGALVR